MKKTIITILVRVFALFGILLFGMMLIYSVNNYFKLTGDDWKNVAGIVLSTSVVKNEGRKGTSWCPKVKYSYQVNGIDFKDDSIHINGQCSLIKSDAFDQLKNYKKGQVVVVNYLPLSPDKGALIQGVHWSDYLLIFLAVISLSAFTFLLFAKVKIA